MKNNTTTSEGTCELNHAVFRKVVLLSATLFLLSFRGNLPHSIVTYEKHNLLYWAELLVSHITGQTTDYRHKEADVHWEGINGNTSYECFTDCSGFINALLQQTYGCDKKYFKSWLGTSRPLAYNYYDAIYAENQFMVISNIHDIQPGDLVAIKYKDRSQHDDNTGHLLLIAGEPQIRKPTAIIEPGMAQYEITIIDASKRPHDQSDSRYTSTGCAYAGLGKGLFRLYANAQGTITGYSWSTEKPKAGFDPFANPVIVGRSMMQNKE